MLGSLTSVRLFLNTTPALCLRLGPCQAEPGAGRPHCCPGEGNCSSSCCWQQCSSGQVNDGRNAGYVLAPFVWGPCIQQPYLHTLPVTVHMYVVAHVCSSACRDSDLLQTDTRVRMCKNMLCISVCTRISCCLIAPVCACAHAVAVVVTACAVLPCRELGDIDADLQAAESQLKHAEIGRDDLVKRHSKLKVWRCFCTQQPACRLCWREDQSHHNFSTVTA